jgi:hypothetical protein
MKRLLIVASLTLGALAVAAPASLARDQTTSPGYNFTIKVTMTDGNVTLSRSVAKRGWLAHFVVVNRGKKGHVFDVGGLKTKLILPGKKGRVGAYLDNRGQYAVKLDARLRGYFTVV